MSTNEGIVMSPTFAGRDWFYDFREIGATFSDAACKKVVARLFERYSKLTKVWSKELNSRMDMSPVHAAKLIMSATLHVNSVQYAEDRNLRVVVPYLRYYSVLSVTRGVLHPSRARVERWSSDSNVS